jgi:O-antigen/teichoic acid export membrane protein
LRQIPTEVTQMNHRCVTSTSSTNLWAAKIQSPKFCHQQIFNIKSLIQDSLFKKFYKDYFNYFLGVIIPAIINFSIIPVVKNLLGDKDYGDFTLYYSAFLFLVFGFTGGASHTLIRFYPANKNESTYYNSILQLSIKPLLFLGIPLFCLLAFYFKQPFFFCLLFLLNLFFASFQTTALAFAQAQLQSRQTLIGEAIRTILFFCSTLFFLKRMGDQVFYKEKIFSAIAISYLFSAIYLFYQNGQIKTVLVYFFKKAESLQLAKNIKKYWLQITVWFLIVYLYSFTDRFFVDYYFKDKALVGNFSAVNDIIIRGIAIVITPILTSAFPLVVKTHESNQKANVQPFINKLIIVELIGMGLALIAYWLFGQGVLKSLLKVPDLYDQVLQNGFLVIAGSFLWQIAMLIHKPLELDFKIDKMLIAATGAIMISILLNIFLMPSLGVFTAGISLIVGALVYISISLASNKSSSK